MMLRWRCKLDGLLGRYRLWWGVWNSMFASLCRGRLLLSVLGGKGTFDIYTAEFLIQCPIIYC
jgi:hypothetical protein